VRPVSARLSVLLALVVAAAAASGCGAGDVIDDKKTEIALSYDLREATGEKISSVSCPADVPASVGTRFTCLVESASGREAVAEIEITSSQGDLKVLSLKKP